VAPSYLIRN